MSGEDLYEVLDVPRTASPEEIRESYKKLVLLYHPDKPTGNAEKFKQVQEAYEVLRSPEKREMYDMTGSTGQDNGGGFPGSGGGGFPGGFPFGMGMGGGGFHVDMSDIFGSMFGGMGGPKKRQTVRRPKGPNKVHEIALSLKDFYFGKSMRFDLERQIFCSDCSGSGCLNWKTCNDCKGSGVKESAIQIGPGMIAMNRAPCNTCGAEGRLKGTTCKLCVGKGLVEKKNVLEVEIKAGTPVGHILTFEGMCSDTPESERPGDVLIRILAADEDLDIVRDGNTLIKNITISLKESLLGTERKIENHPKYPEGYTFQVPQGVQNQEIFFLNEQGMPIMGTGAYGDIRVQVTVVASEEEKKILEKNKAILQTLF